MPRLLAAVAALLLVLSGLAVLAGAGQGGGRLVYCVRVEASGGVESSFRLVVEPLPNGSARVSIGQVQGSSAALENPPGEVCG